MRKPFLIPVFMVMISGFNIVLAMFVAKLATKFGKKKLTMGGMLICFLAYLGMYFAKGSPVFFTFTAIVALSGAIPYLLIWSFVADVADETEKVKESVPMACSILQPVL